MKQKSKILLRTALKLVLFLAFIGIWIYFVHEPMHYTGCKIAGLSPEYNLGFPSPNIACEGIIEQGAYASFLYWSLPYVVGTILTVLYFILSRGIWHNKFGFAPRLFRYVIFLDVIINFFDYSKSDFHMIELHAGSTLTMIAFCIVAITVILNMLLLRRDIILFKRTVKGPAKPLHHDFVGTIEEVQPEFSLEKVD